MNPCVKKEEKCNESLNNEFKIMRKSNLLGQTMRWANDETNSPYSWIYPKNTHESLDKCRLAYTNVDEPQTNVEE